MSGWEHRARLASKSARIPGLTFSQTDEVAVVERCYQHWQDLCKRTTPYMKSERVLSGEFCATKLLNYFEIELA